MTQRPAPRHAAAALLATLVVATAAGCGFSVSAQGPDAPTSAAPSSVPSTPPAPPAATPGAAAPVPGAPGPATTGAGSRSDVAGVDCAGNPATHTVYIDAVAATVDDAPDGSLEGVDVVGHPSSLFCGGPDDLSYDADLTRTVDFRLDGDARVSVLEDDATTTSPLPLDQLPQWLVQHPSTNSWAMITLSGTPATFVEQYHP